MRVVKSANRIGDDGFKAESKVEGRRSFIAHEFNFLFVGGIIGGKILGLFGEKHP